MSNKRQIRKARRAQERERKQRGGLGPTWTFLVVIALGLVAVGVWGFFLRSGEAPPWPGAIWSEAHGHWH